MDAVQAPASRYPAVNRTLSPSKKSREREPTAAISARGDAAGAEPGYGKGVGEQSQQEAQPGRTGGRQPPPAQQGSGHQQVRRNHAQPERRVQNIVEGDQNDREQGPAPVPADHWRAVSAPALCTAVSDRVGGMSEGGRVSPGIGGAKASS
jgi:hypothetical protein